MVFWAIAGAITLLSLLWMIRPWLWAKGAGETRADYDIQVFKEQLSALDKAQAEGQISAEEAQTTRTEISRRLLAAADQAEGQASTAPGGLTKGAVIGAALILIAGGFGVYLSIGAPGAPDQPLSARIAQISEARDSRPGQSAVEARLAEMQTTPLNPLLTPEQQRYAELVSQLEEVLQTRPNDARGFRLLAQAQSRLERYSEARKSMEYVLQLEGDAAPIEDIAQTVNLMVIAANGYVSPEAETYLTRALRMDPRNQMIRYYAGLSLAQTGRADLAYPIWAALASDPEVEPVWADALAADLPQVAAIANRPMPEIARAAPLRGPSAEDIEAAQDMTAEDRTQMIAGMVDGLMERLATEGGSPDEWARLIRALNVLGRTDDAAEIAAEARQVFAGNDAALNAIEAAAR